MDTEREYDTEVDAELPDHERDEYRRRREDSEPEPGPDPVEEAGLPEHERDERDAQEGEDTGPQVGNP